MVLYSTFGDAWVSILKVHEVIGNQRIKFASIISEAAEDLISLSRSIEKERKKVHFHFSLNDFIDLKKKKKDQRRWYAL